MATPHQLGQRSNSIFQTSQPINVEVTQQRVKKPTRLSSGKSVGAEAKAYATSDYYRTTKVKVDNG